MSTNAIAQKANTFLIYYLQEEKKRSGRERDGRGEKVKRKANERKDGRIMIITVIYSTRIREQEICCWSVCCRLMFLCVMSSGRGWIVFLWSFSLFAFELKKIRERECAKKRTPKMGREKKRRTENKVIKCGTEKYTNRNKANTNYVNQQK